MTPVEDLLRDALTFSDEEHLDALRAAGPDAVRCFRDYLGGAVHLSLDAVSVRARIDATATVSSMLAMYFPDEYLASFHEPRWTSHPFVVDGLGLTARPEVRPTLIRTLRESPSEFARQAAARVLVHVPGPTTVEALIEALDDIDPLVRHWASGRSA